MNGDIYLRTIILVFILGVSLPAGQAQGQFYEPIAVSLPERYQGQDVTLPLELERITNLDWFGLSEEAKALLETHGFVVVPADWHEFYQVYERNAYWQSVPGRDGEEGGFTPTFITTDAVFHAYHLVFSKLLRDLERRELAPALTSLTDALVDAAQAELALLEGGAREGTLLALAYLSVAQQLLHETPPPLADEVREVVEQELALIRAHSDLTEAPLLQASHECNEPYREDYSQYTVRGHYTTREDLARYFRAMIWYGRINFRLCSALETRAALVVTDLMQRVTVEGRAAAEVWASIYDPTVFLVGSSDDLGFRDYAPLMQEIFSGLPAGHGFAAEIQLEAFREVARQLPRPRINSLSLTLMSEEERQADKTDETQGFRFMGQRFVLDGYVFEELTYRQVGSMGEERYLPMALDLFAAKGSEEALTILDALGETHFDAYLSQLEQVRAELAAFSLGDWTSTLYNAWLYAFEPLITVKDERFPSHMRTQAWTRKSLHTALGSFTQLKHDTILYAKQMMAQGGGGMTDIPGGWVEADPEAFARLLALVRTTRLGLEHAGILTDYQLDLEETPYASWLVPYDDVTARNLLDLESMLIFLVSAAQRQLAGEMLEPEEYDRIHHFGHWMVDMTLRSSDNLDDPDMPADAFSGEERAAITADIATAPSGQVLQEAVGDVFEIYVAIPHLNFRVRDEYDPSDPADLYELVTSDGLQLARGGVFSYYEFVRGPGARLTNEAWRALLDAGEAPAQPDWTQLFIAPAE